MSIRRMILLAVAFAVVSGCAKVEDPNTPVEGSAVEQEIRDLNDIRAKEWGESSTGVGPQKN